MTFVMRTFFVTILVCASTLVVGQATDTVIVFFDHNQHETNRFGVLIETFKNSNIIDSIIIIGYTDNLGNEAYNKTLSEHRAQFVANWIGSNFQEIRIASIRGAGEIGTENEKANAENRRVDIIVYKKPKTQQIPMLAESPEPKSTLVDKDDVIEIGTNDTNIILEGVNFIGGQHYPLPESRPAIEKLLRTMRKYSDLKIEIQGYICCEYDQFDGLDFHTQTMNLSENRAKYLYDYLIDNGIRASRLSYKGYGSSKPLVFPEVTEEDRIKNRRVEIKILD